MTTKLCALSIAVAFLFGSLTLAAAQQAPAPAPAPAAKPAEKPAEKMPAKPAAKVKRASGTVKSVSEDSLVLEVTQKDKTKKDMTFALDKTTKISKSGKSVTAKDVKVGDAVSTSYEEGDAGKMMAKSVSVRAPAKEAAKTPAAPAEKK